MNARKARAIRKAAKKYLPGYIDGIKELLREKPWWAPQWYWRWRVNSFFDIDVL